MKRILTFIAVSVLIYACKTTETVIPNRPPNAFTISQTLKSDGKTIVLNWTKAKDPDGDAVTYAVVLKDTLTQNISDTTYTISSLDFNYNQVGKVIAKDAKGLKTEVSFTVSTKVVVFVAIPDAVFEKALIDLKIDKDGLVNGRMDIEDAKGVTILDLNSKNIKSLAGIEAFIGLKNLNCSTNLLTTLDISKNTNLTDLVCFKNQLTTLDVSKNTSLENLFCYDNLLTALDVSNNPNLQILFCSNNKLSSLNVSKNTSLTRLFCGNNQIAALDVSNNKALIYFYCYTNSLQTLDVSNNTALEFFLCNINQLTAIDVTKNTKLTIFKCELNKLTTLDISKNLALTEFYCFSNQIKTICVADVEKATIATTNKTFIKDTAATYSICK